MKGSLLAMGFAAGVLGIAGRVAAGDSPAADEAWSTYHGGPALTGVSSAKLPDAPVRLWRFSAGGAVSQPPVSDNARIYFTTSKDEVVAIDLKGSKVWAKQIKAPAADGGQAEKASFTAPLIAVNGFVVAGSDSGGLFGLDAASGDVKWGCEIGAQVMGTPNWLRTAANEYRVVAINQPDGSLHCVNLADGKEVWKGDGPERCDGSPAVLGGKIVYGSCAAALHVFGADDGKEAVSISLCGECQVAGGVALSGGQAFAGNRSGTLVCGDMAKGTVIWTNDDGDGELFSTPAVTESQVVFAAGNGKVYCAGRKDGKRLWVFEPGAGSASSPVVAGDKVLVSAEGKLHVLALADGRKLATLEVSDTITSPSVIGGMAVVGAGDGSVYAFGAGDGKGAAPGGAKDGGKKE